MFPGRLLQKSHFPTDGQAFYVTEIKRRTNEIQLESTERDTTFAIQYVGLVALTHILRLIYVHRGSRIGGEVLRCFEGDLFTRAMIVIFENVVGDDEVQWLRTRQGAAGVLLQEMQEVWHMVCTAGPVQLQQNLSGVLWYIFRYRAVPGSPSLAS